MINPGDQYNQIGKQYLEAKKAYFNNHEPWGTYLDRILPPLKDKVVVDIGCAAGSDLKNYHKQGAAQIVGIEPSEVLREEGLKFDQTSILSGDFEHIPLPDHFADIVIGKLSLHYLNTFDQAYQEVSRVLKPGGLCAFLVPHPLCNLHAKQNKNYQNQKVISVELFNASVLVSYPSHTFTDYVSEAFLRLFALVKFEECLYDNFDGVGIPTLLVFSGKKIL